MNNKEIVYWKQRNGGLISVDEMDINHLRNVLKMIVKNSNKHKIQHKEAKQFKDLCDATECDIY